MPSQSTDSAAPLHGLVIPADIHEPARIVDLHEGQQPVYKALQDQVGGNIEVVTLDEGDVWLNDMGRLTDLPLNVRASHWMLHDSAAGREGRVGEGLMVYGDVVVTGGPDEDGETTSVSADLVAHIQSLEVNPNAMKDWDTRNTDVTITFWSASDPSPDIGL